MSSVIVITPLIVAGWPVVSAAVTAAIGTMGFSIIPSKRSASAVTQSQNRAEIEVEESDILSEAGAAQREIVVERDGIRATFSRDARGALKLCIDGEGHEKAELHRIGQELMGRVTQQYAYHRIVTELRERNMTIVDEEIGADRTVKLRVRNG
ncbi:MAG TPA: DUF1257 domain-containing protein [Tepidisphaeraceae bacterium]|jgi:hypothetical protein|nr:DUF1257 domain-containing protein [Tepidisphaeraceae bacterium]